MNKAKLLGMVCTLGLANALSKAETVVSNLQGTDNGSVQVANDIWWGAKFITDNRSYLLNSVTISAEAYRNNRMFSVNIYTAGDRFPGGLLDGGHLQGENPDSRGLYAYAATAAVELKPNTPYYLVVGVEPFGSGPWANYGQFYWRVGKETATGKWDVSPTLYVEFPDTGWATYGNSPLRFAIDATAVSEPTTGLLLSAAVMVFVFCGRPMARSNKHNFG